MSRTTTLLLLAACLTGTSAIAGECYTASIVATVQLPDGSQHDAGSIRLCRERLSPVVGIHRAYVDGMPIGIYRSSIKQVEAELAGSGASMLFERDPQGRMTLIAAMLPGDDGLRLYDLRGSGSVLSHPSIAAVPNELVHVAMIRAG